MELLFILFVIVIILLVSVSNKTKENNELMVDNYWKQFELQYKRTSTSKLYKILEELKKEYDPIIEYKKKQCLKDRSYVQYTTDYTDEKGKIRKRNITDEEQLLRDAENYMCYDKKTMRLYVEVNVIESILRDRDAL